MDNTKQFINRLLFKFKDLSQLGTPTTGTAVLGSLLNNEKIYNISPERMNFYMQLMESITNPDPTVAETVLKRENLTRTQRREINDKLNIIRNFWTQQEEDAKTKAITDINSKLGTSVLTQGIKLEESKQGGTSGGALSIADLKKTLGLADTVSTNKLGDTFTNKDDLNKQKAATLYKTHPIYSPKNEGITWGDRAIFITITYLLRSMSVFFVEWSLYSGFIKTFQGAFSLYFGIYIALYALFLFLVNTREKDMLFRMLFFYSSIDSDDGKGILRILLHVICIFVLIPIPFIVKEYREFQEPEILSFTEKSNILAGVDKFTLYAWILTSIVAITV